MMRYQEDLKNGNSIVQAQVEFDKAQLVNVLEKDITKLLAYRVAEELWTRHKEDLMAAFSKDQILEAATTMFQDEIRERLFRATE